jgi:hypothetical protein
MLSIFISGTGKHDRERGRLGEEEKRRGREQETGGYKSVKLRDTQ